MKLNNNKGITMLEVMVSIIIFGIGILGIAPMIGLAIYNNSLSNDGTIADALAQKQIENLLNISDYGPLPYNSTKDSINGIYTIVERVDDQSTDGTVPAGVFRINIEVSWSDKQNMPRSYNYVTFKPQS